VSGQWSPVAAAHRRSVLIRRIVVLAVLLGVLVTAAVLWPKAQPGGLTVATTAAVDPSGALQGKVAAVRAGDRVCFSVTRDGGASVLRFPPGWSSDAELDLRDPSGLVVAQPGDTLVLLGRPGAIGSVPGCTDRGRIWTVTSIRTGS
jgi:hypothetical protein